MSEPTHDDLADLRRLATRLQPDQVTWEQPPAGLWDRIAAEAHVEPIATSAPIGDESVVVPLQHRRRTHTAVWLLGAAAAIMLVVAGVVVATSGGDGGTVVAQAPLDPLGATGSGRAELLDDGGTLSLHVETSDLDAGDGFLELWVIDPSVSRLVSLGPLRPDGTYELPAGLDLREFPIVDVSVEPIDGDPTHSGNSVLRGQLEV
jgi:hypothetical protein